MEQRVSSGPQNKRRLNFDHYSKGLTNGGNDKHPVEKKKRPMNRTKQLKALVGAGQDSVFHNLDFRAILILREEFRLYNITYKLHYEKGKQSGSKKRKNKKREPEDNITKAMTHKYCNENGIPVLTTTTHLLRHLRGMAKFGADKVHFIQRGVPKSLLPEYPWLVSRDLSNGQEDKCILATNMCDDPPIAPTGFTYIKSIQVSSNVIVQPSAEGCRCKGSCTNEVTCSCAGLNGSEFPYVNGGRLIEARDVIFECGPTCGCSRKCGNVISQKGLNYQLEVYRTPKKGWAVRTWDFIPSGAPVIEYVGVLSKSDDLENVTNNDYIFDIDCLQTINEVEGRKKRLRDVLLPRNPSAQRDGKTMESGPEFCIDAGSFGNVARFFNHSCKPNIFIQCVQSPHLNIKQARVVLFAAQDIEPYQELTYDYGYQLDSVSGPDGKIKQLPCHCGARTCQKRLY